MVAIVRRLFGVRTYEIRSYEIRSCHIAKVLKLSTSTAAGSLNQRLTKHDSEHKIGAPK